MQVVCRCGRATPMLRSTSCRILLSVQPSIAPVDRRLERAQQHIDGLHSEMAKAFVEYGTYDVSHECDVQTREHAFWLNVHETPDPIRWGVLIGDSVHQSRAALDNLAYQLSLITTNGRHVGGTAFPILDHPDRWAEVFPPTSAKAGQFTSRSGEHKLRKVPPLAKDMIKSLQPSNGKAGMNRFAEGPQTDDRIRRSLLILEQFWNMDKHRVPATAITAGFLAPPDTSGIAFRGTSVLGGVPVTFGYKLPFADRTKLVSWTPLDPFGVVPMEGEFRPFVLFEEGGPGDDQSVRGTLQTCLNDVRAVVDRFRKFF